MQPQKKKKKEKALHPRAKFKQIDESTSNLTHKKIKRKRYMYVWDHSDGIPIVD